MVSDPETVIDAAEVEHCSLLGISGGAASTLAHAARNPDRVKRVVCYEGWARGRFLREDEERSKAYGAEIRTGWAAPNPAVSPPVHHGVPAGGHSRADGLVRRAPAAHEPAWDVFISELRGFLGSRPAPAGALADLSRRERDVTTLVAEG